MKSLQGHLLVASPKLSDPNFFHTVVLLIQHDDEGAFGVVLNRPMQTTIAEAWEQVSEIPCLLEGPLHTGGPCNGPLMALHTHTAAEGREVLPGLYFSTERSDLEAVVAEDAATARFFVGYAGWAPDQLEGELKEGSWLVAEANVPDLFDDSEDLWHSAIRSIARSAPLPGVNPKTIPADPSMN